MEGRWQKKSLLQRNGRGAAPLLGRKRSRLSGARRSRARRQRRAGGRRRRRRRRSEDSWSPKTQTGRRLPVAGGALEARVFQRKRRSAVDGPTGRQPSQPLEDQGRLGRLSKPPSNGSTIGPFAA